MAVTLSLQIKGAQLVRRGLQNLKAEIPKIGAQRIYDALKRAQDRMKKEGKPIRYPVNWDSDRQRAAFFATRGFGKGIPYRRTGAYNRGWHIRRNPSSARAMAGYSLINEMGYARYVGGSAYGDGQSSIHRGRWTMVRDALERETERLPGVIQQHIDMVARRELGAK